MLMLSQSKDGGKAENPKSKGPVPVLLQLRITWNPRIFPFKNKRLVANNNLNNLVNSSKELA